MAPAFSVVVISHNQRELVASAIESIVADGNVEIICVDDASTDGTSAFLDQVAACRSDVRVIHHARVGKPSVLRNAGIAVASGHWLCFLDGDDLYDEARFVELVAALNETTAHDVIFHNHVVFVDGEPIDLSDGHIGGDLQEEMIAAAGMPHVSAPSNAMCLLDGDRLGVFLLARTFAIHISAFCVRRELLLQRKISFDEGRVFGEDHRFMLECIVNSVVAYLPRNLSYYRRHFRSLTAQRTLSAQRELLDSMTEQAALLERRTPAALRPVSRAAIRSHLLSETLHLGYLLELAGRTGSAVSVYVRASTRFSSAKGWLRAAKALVRRAR